MARLQELTMTRGNRLLLALALAAGLVAAVLVFVVLQNNDEEAAVSGGGGTVSVVVAAQDINAGTEITSEMVKVVEIPESLLISSAAADAQLIVGQTARVRILQGEQLAPSKVGVQNDGEGLAFVVPLGMRAVAIDVEEVTAVGGLLLPGSKVDVISAQRYFNEPGLAENEELLRVTTILQNVEVLSVAQEAQEPAPRGGATEPESPADAPTSGEIPGDSEEQPRAGTVTVALTPAQVQLLIQAQETADHVWLSLRAFGDDVIVEVASHDVIIEDR